MKRMTYFVMALAMVLGFTQCKKEQPTPQTQGVRITLTVDGGNSNSRVDVNPTGHTNPDYATVTFEENDVIYVGYNNAYVGTLTYSNGTFSGSVNIDSYDGIKPLHFYFLGGVGFTPTIDETNNTATVNISNQTEKYPVISYNTSNESFTGEGHYSAKLLNKVSIMKFNVTTPSTAAICITGMNNTVSVNFETPNGTDNGFSYSQTDGGLIKMKGQEGTGVKTYWAIVLPQVSVPMGSAYTEDWAYIGTRPAIEGGIGSNEYHNADFAMSVNTELSNSTPLTLEALTDGTIVVNDPQSGMQYSLNGGAKAPVTSDAINVSASDKVAFYGDGTNITSYNGTTIAGGTADVKVYGNIMSLIDETGYATCTTLQDNVFMGLFSGNTKLTDASGLLLPATELALWCYAHMFYGCTSLTTAPALPAATLAEWSYAGMFGNCTSLTTAPALPAATLAGGCYENMFSGCESLTTAPTLPAETLAKNCYYYMFNGCKGLTTAPALPATTLDEGCYSSMFEGCTSLVTAPALPATTLAKACYRSMFKGCTSLTTAPALPATTLANYCYFSMFNGCTSLSNITCLATSGINENSSTNYWVNGVASTGTFTKASGSTWPEGSNGIPSGWTVNEQ